MLYKYKYLDSLFFLLFELNNSINFGMFDDLSYITMKQFVYFLAYKYNARSCYQPNLTYVCWCLNFICAGACYLYSPANIRSWGYKTVFVLNSTGHGNSTTLINLNAIK